MERHSAYCWIDLSTIDAQSHKYRAVLRKNDVNILGVIDVLLTCCFVVVLCSL